jgi:hypothetical protein
MASEGVTKRPSIHGRIGDRGVQDVRRSHRVGHAVTSRDLVGAQNLPGHLPVCQGEITSQSCASGSSPRTCGLSAVEAESCGGQDRAW